MSSIYEAFATICEEARSAENSEVYVSLYQQVRKYGGPEEGGWFYTNSYLSHYQKFLNREQAEKAYKLVLNLAAELTKEGAKKWSDTCRKQVQKAESMGMDVDDLYGAGAPDQEGWFVVIEDVLGSHNDDSRPYYE